MSEKDTLILAIESSCDETAASVVKNGRCVLSNIISSQIAIHTLYGGVVPEIASRKHIEKINQVVEAALKEADVTLDDIGEPIVEADIAASFQQAVVDVLVDNAIRAAKDYHMDRLAIAGGVASNGALRAAMEAACEKEGIRFYRPSPIFCTDNAAMIGVAAYYEYQKGTRHGWDLNAVPNLKLGER